jgi:hypothetical protein
MTEKHYIVTHYADGTPSETRELSEEEYAELTSGGKLINETQETTA